jgi:hypothetical protein
MLLKHVYNLCEKHNFRPRHLEMIRLLGTVTKVTKKAIYAIS